MDWEKGPFQVLQLSQVRWGKMKKEAPESLPGSGDVWLGQHYQDPTLDSSRLWEGQNMWFRGGVGSRGDIKRLWCQS
jgi:hypothetical protein